MPVFILISGYCFNRHKDWRYNVNSSIENFAVYVVFQVIWIILRQEYTLEQILTPRSTLWFLMSIPFWKILSVATRQLSLLMVLIISLCFSILSAFVAQPEIIQNIFTCWLYFVVGMLLKEHDSLAKMRKNRFRIPIAVFLVLTTLVCYFVFDIDSHRFIIGRGTLANYEYGIVSGIAAKIGFQVLSIIMCLSVIALTPDVPILAKYGKHTLSVYVFHLFFLHALMTMGRYFGVNISYSLIAVYTCIAIYGSILIGKTKIGTFVLKPIKLNK